MLILLLSLCFVYRRLLRYLRFFQQEQYIMGRYVGWIFKSRAFDTRASLVALAMVVWPASWVGIVALALITLLEDDPRKCGKVPLRMTPRATRLFWAAFGLSAVVMGSITILSPRLHWGGQLMLFQAVPFTLIAASLLLIPDERRRQRRFIEEAKQRLVTVNPFVIGITGSYGKTSTKQALGEILRLTMGPTFWPAKGINADMGIVREIRGKLKPGHEYAVIEMGAFGRGSIERLCRLTPPKAGIITAVGTAHLERFGSQEEIRKAKGELAEALPNGGLLVCNGDSPGARTIGEHYNRGPTLFYGFNSDLGRLNCAIESHSTTEQGSHFHLRFEEKVYEGTTPLLGETALLNLAGAFTMAVSLGADPEYVLAVIATLEPVDNRLQVDRTNKGVVYLRDAYNSNPTGFRAALETTSALPARRKIVMTPGVIELADLQNKENHALGVAAAKCCDIGLVVGATNRSALSSGMKAGGMPPEKVICCNTRAEAFAKLKEIQQEGDLVLIENDLPDLYTGGDKW